MIRRIAIAATGFLVLLSLALPLDTRAQNTSSTASQSSLGAHQSKGGAIRRMRRRIKRMRKRIRSMRPGIKRREARRRALYGNGSTNSTIPNNATTAQPAR